MITNYKFSNYILNIIAVVLSEVRYSPYAAIHVSQREDKLLLLLQCFHPQCSRADSLRFYFCQIKFKFLITLLQICFNLLCLTNIRFRTPFISARKWYILNKSYPLYHYHVFCNFSSKTKKIETHLISICLIIMLQHKVANSLVFFNASPHSKNISSYLFFLTAERPPRDVLFLWPFPWLCSGPMVVFIPL